jgi:hypothetical protein
LQARCLGIFVGHGKDLGTLLRISLSVNGLQQRFAAFSAADDANIIGFNVLNHFNSPAK